MAKNNELVKNEPIKHALISFNGIEYPVAFKPAEIIFPDYDSLKKRVNDIRSKYKGWIVTPNDLDSASGTANELNNLKKAINSQRIEITNQAKKPADDFMHQINALVSEIDATRKEINTQLNAYKKKAKEDKHEQHVKFIKKACEDADVDPSKIKYNDSWDNKTYSNPKFKAEVYEQVEILHKNKQQLETNKRIIVNKANELGIPFAHYFDQLQREVPLDQILNDMQGEKDELIAIAQRQKETKKQEQADLVKHGDKAIDPKTGEVKEKTYTVRLELEQITKYQWDQLKRFLKDWGIKARRVK